MMRAISVSIITTMLLVAQQADATPYTPVGQILSWCKSKEPAQFGMCFGYIQGVLEEATTADNSAGGGYISTQDIPANKMVSVVVAYLDQLPREQVSGPAAPKVLEALRK